MKKQCSKCKKEKIHSEFHKDKRTKSGLYSACKSCHYECLKEWRKKNPERAKELNRISNKNWREKNQEKEGRRQKGRYQKRREYFLEYQKNYSLENPEKVLAATMVRDAIKKGFIERKPCETCGNVKSHGHHDDYRKPFEVRWLCSKHHRLHHKLLKTTP
jgi:hypothetical protein